MRLPDDAYYEDRPVPHTQQGDVHDAVPRSIFVAEAAPAVGGQRKRPDELDPEAIEHPLERTLAVVCHYTCGFLAQPPSPANHGKYSHQYRLMAPLMHLRRLAALGWSGRDLRALTEQGYLHGVMYVPWPKRDKQRDEWSGQAAILAYAMSSIRQSVLDSSGCPRISRMTAAAQRLLAIRLAQVVTPWTFDPQDENLGQHDLSDGWPGPVGSES